MKRLGLIISAFLLCVSISFAQGNNSNSGKEPFAVTIDKLSSYLDLAPWQINEVADINDYFIEMQRESLSQPEVRKDKKMHQAVYGNLKLMKQALTADQYKKYLVILNVTNNNNRMAGFEAIPDMYLADNNAR